MLRKTCQFIVAVLIFALPCTAFAGSVFEQGFEPDVNAWAEVTDMLNNKDYDKVQKMVELDGRVAVDKLSSVRLDINDTTALWETSKEQLGTGTEASETVGTIIGEDIPDYISPKWEQFADEVYNIPSVRWGGGQSNQYNLWNEIQGYYNRKKVGNVYDDDQYKRHHIESGIASGYVDNVGPVLQLGLMTYINAFEMINPDIGFIFCYSPFAATPEENLKFTRWCLDDPNESVYGKMRAEMGHPKPIKITAIEIGNEVYYRSVDAEESVLKDMTSLYCERYMENAELIYDYYPQIPIVPCMICTHDDLMPGVNESWNISVLEKIGPFMIEHYEPGKRILADHNYYAGRSIVYGEQFANSMVQFCIDLFGEDHGFKLMMSEHSKWATDHPSAINLNSALATAEYLNRAYQWEDNLMWGSQYYGFYHPSLWAMVDKDADGNLITTAVNDIYDLYEKNMGDRIVETDVVTLDDSDIGNIYSPAYRFSSCVSFKGEKEIKIILCNRTDNTDIDVELNFETGNDYKLIQEEVITAPNLYSFKFNEKTKDIIKRNVYDRNIDGFTNYRIPAYSIAVLTLKSDVKLPEIGEKMDYEWEGSNQFDDIKNSNYQNSINFLASKKILQGDENNNFKPKDSLSRAEFAAMLCRLQGLDTGEISDRFEDVKPDAWYAGVVCAAVKNGYMKGVSAHKFEPDREISLAEVMAILYRVASSKELITLNNNSENMINELWGKNVNEWEYDGLKFAISYGLLDTLDEHTVRNKDDSLKRECVSEVLFLTYKNFFE